MLNSIDLSNSFHAILKTLQNAVESKQLSFKQEILAIIFCEGKIVTVGQNWVILIIIYVKI